MTHLLHHLYPVFRLGLDILMIFVVIGAGAAIVFSGHKPRSLAILLAGLLCGGCATTNHSPSYPPAIQGQCEQAYGQGRAMYCERFGEPSKPLYWQVTAIPGERWGEHWAIHPSGVMVGGETVGNRTKIGVGPNMEVNQNDLAHEGFEAFSQIHGKKVH